METITDSLFKLGFKKTFLLLLEKMLETRLKNLNSDHVFAIQSLEIDCLIII